ncbi:MAG: CvpA family protein [Candidatus Falkowbacteria bacterium]|nr:CvpA family protein [Candidatus Falkowbacteria bacterium]
MAWFDVAVIVILTGFVWYGFFFGFIQVVGNLVGLLAGAYLASRFYIPVFNWLDRFLPLSPTTGKVIVFIICFGIVSRLISWLFVLLEQAFKVISIIPLLKTANRILGLVFGLAEGIFILGIVAYLFDRHLPNTSFLNHWLDSSSLAPRLVDVSKVIVPCIPKLISRLQSLF